MKPISITIQNLRSFRTTRTIEFTDTRLYAIIGDTGAGKTSILEAMTYALYNRTTWSGSNVKSLVAEGAKFMAVTFTFSVGEHAYTVWRRTAAGATQPEHRLRCETLNIEASGEIPVREAIEAALGMSVDTFLSTVLLPQGQHAALLLATGKDKTKILGDIFRLEDIPAIDACAVELSSKAAGLLSGLRSVQERYPANVDEAIAAAETECARAATALEQAKALQVAAVALGERAGALAGEHQAITARKGVVERLTQSLTDLDELAHDGQELDAEKRRCAEALDAARGEEAVAKQVIAALKETAADSPALRAVEQAITALERQEEERDRERARLQADKEQQASIAGSLVPLSAKVASLQDELGAAGSAERAARARLAPHEAALRDLEAAVDARSAVSKRVDAAANALAKCQDDQHRLTEQVTQAEQAVTAATAAHETAEQAHASAATAELAAQIGEHLHAGDMCPVCTQTVPASYSPPAIGEGLKAARAALKTATAALNAATGACQQLVGALERLGQQVVAAEQAFVAAGEELSSADASIAPHLLAGEEATQALQRLKAAVAGSMAAEQHARTERERLDAALTPLRAEFTKQQTIHTRLTEEIAGRSSAVEQRTTRCDRLAEAIPQSFAEARDAATRAAARARLAQQIAGAVAAEQRLTIATSALSDCTSALADAERAFAETVLARRGAILEQMRAAADALGLPPQPRAEAQRERWVNDTLRPAIVTEGTRCEGELDAIARREVELQAERVGLLGDPPRDAQQALTQCMQAVAHGQASLDRIRREAAETVELRAKIASLEPAALGLDTLHRALGAREFLLYARERRQRRLLQQATLVFKEMTSDRYEFSEGFEIIDRQTNGTRAPQALSGGEKFLASLALSLAVVEIAASTGAKIESLFIDEGFASLDSDSLEMAMLALRDRARRGRPIGVISHLREVGQYVDGTFRIDATPEGSNVSYTEGPIEEEAPVSLGLVSHALGA